MNAVVTGLSSEEFVLHADAEAGNPVGGDCVRGLKPTVEEIGEVEADSGSGSEVDISADGHLGEVWAWSGNSDEDGAVSFNSSAGPSFSVEFVAAGCSFGAEAADVERMDSHNTSVGPSCGGESVAATFSSGGEGLDGDCLDSIDPSVGPPCCVVSVPPAFPSEAVGVDEDGMGPLASSVGLPCCVVSVPAACPTKAESVGEDCPGSIDSSVVRGCCLASFSALCGVGLVSAAGGFDVDGFGDGLLWSDAGAAEGA